MARSHDRDRESNRSERSERGGKSERVSLSSKAAIETGLFSSGPATIKESIYAEYTYNNGTKAPVWLITYTRKGEEPYEQAYSLGQGWKVKGGELIPLAGQTGLPSGCNAMRHLVKPLEKLDVPQELLDAGDPTFLEGAEVVLKRAVQEKRDIRRKPGRAQSQSDDRERTILEIEEITSAPWETKGSGKRRAARDEDEEPEEKPRRGRAARDEEPEEEKPTRGGKGGGKGKAEPEDEDDETALLEEGIEALIGALEEEDGPIAEDDLEDALAKQLKKHPKADAIVETMLGHLDDEKGWTYNAKKKTVTLD